MVSFSHYTATAAKALLAIALYGLSLTAFAQFDTRDQVTFFLPADFGVDTGVGYEGFSQCSSTPPYICQKIVIKNNDRVILTEAVDFTVQEAFQLENNTSFNDECFAMNVTVTEAFILKNNGRFTGNVTAEKEIKLENNAVLNGDATSIPEEKIEIANNAVINGVCTPLSAVEGGGTCTGGVSQCGIPLALEKTPSRAVISPGDLLTYTLDFANEGTDTVSDTVLTDQVPANTTFISASGGGMEAGGVVTWTGDLSGGEESSVTVDVRVDGNAANGTLITNDALIQAVGATDAMDQATVVVEFLPLLTLQKVANVEVAAPGERITYTLTVENIGNQSATNVTLVDVLDPDTSFVSATGGGTHAGGVVSWSAAEVQSGSIAQVTVTVEVNPGVPDGVFLVNQSTVDSFETAPVDTLEFVLVDTGPRLDLQKTADQEVVEAGEVLTYTLTFSNIGTPTAENATLVDNLPLDTVVESISGGGLETTPGVVTWNLGSLTSGESGQVQLAVRVNSPLPDDTRLINRSIFTADEVDEPAYSETETRVASRPLLNLQKLGDKSVVTPGDTLTYTITALNTGNAKAFNLELEDAVPENTTFVSASGNGMEDAGRVTWSIPELTINIPQVFTLTVEVDNPLADQTQIFNSATLTGDTQSVTAEFTSTVKSEAILGLTKTASAEQVAPGEEITYELVFENTGNAIAEELFLEDPIPNFTTFVSASDGGQLVDNSVIWTTDSLAPGTRGEVFLTVVTDDVLNDGTRIYNVASADAKDTRSVTADAESFINSAPILELTKTVDKSVAAPGDQLTYTLSVANTGNANALNATLEDTLPPNTSFVSATGDFTLNADTVQWSVASLPAGGAGAVTLVVLVDSPLDPGTSILNSATLDADNSPPTTSEVVTQIESTPLLKLEKVASSNPVAPGSMLTYQLTASNTGNANSTTATLVDQLPDNTTFVAASAGGTFANGAVTWDLGSLLVGLPATVSLTVQVASPLDNGTIITNNALLSADNAPDVTTINEVVVNSAPELTIAKSADKDVLQPGEVINYSIDIGNTGNAVARSTVVFDLLPDNTSFVSASRPATLDGREISWEIGDLTPGDKPQLRLVVQADSPLDNQTIIDNFAAVGAENAEPKVASHKSVIESNPVLSLSKTADRSTAQPGDQVTFTLGYANTGNANAASAVISDPIPAFLSFVSATGGGTDQGGTVVWNLGELIAGDPQGQVTVTFQVADPPLENGTPIINTATLSALGAVPASASSTINVQSAPLLSLDKTTDTPVIEPGQPLTFRLAYGNSGNDNADGVVLEDTVPEFTTFLNASNGGTLVGDKVSWNLGTLAIGSPGEVTVTFLVDGPPITNGTQIANTATLNATNTTPVSDTQTVTVSSAPRLTVEKTVDQGVVEPGQELTYTIELGNTGTDTALNPVLEDNVPPNTTFVSATGGGVLNGNTVTWTAPSLPPGVAGSVAMTVRVDSPLDSGTPIYNAATLSADNATSAADDAISFVSSSPLLGLVKDADSDLVLPGQEITYRLSYTNSGNADASSVVLEEIVPQFTSFVRASDGGTLQSGLVVWQVDDLLAGTAGDVSVTFLVDGPPLDSGTQIRNFATLSASEAPSVTAREDVTVISAPLLSVIKEADRLLAQPGENITYTVSVQNLGNDTADNVVVGDQLPEATSLVFASGDYTISGQTLTWEFASLAPGESLELVVIARIDSPLANNTILENFAGAIADNASPAIDSASTRVLSSPELRIEKTTDSRVVQPGDLVEYTLTFGNDGTDTARNGTLEDAIPPNSTFVSATGGGTFANGRVVWPVSQLPADSEASVGLTVRVNDTVSNGDTVTNVAALIMSGVSPVTSTVSLIAQAAPVLEIQKTSSVSEARPGQTVGFEISYSNQGNDVATDVVIEDLLPADTSFVSAPGATFDGVTVSWELGELAPGASGTVLLNLQILPATEAGTVVTNLASIAAANSQPATSNPANVRVIDPLGQPQLSIDLDGTPTLIRPGENINYEVRYANLADASADDTVLIGVLPPDTTFIGASDGGQLMTDGDVSWVTWDLGTLAGNASGAVSYEVRYDTTQSDRALREDTPVAYDTARSLVALAAISASNVSPPQAALTENFVIIEEGGLPPVPVPTLSWWLMLVIILLIIALGLWAIRVRAVNAAS